MEVARGSWASVEVHDFIKDKNSKTWRVLKISETRVRLIDRAGTEVDIVRPPAEREVDILSVTDEEARHTLAKALGARVLASRSVDGAYNCPDPSTWDLAAARWHMERFHRRPCEDLSLDEIRQIHASDHPPIPHDHTEET
jgi:hypothetical protein